MVSTRTDGVETADGLAEAGSARDLGEHHAEQLVHAGQRSRAAVAAVTFHGLFESAAGKQIDHLRIDGSALVHPRIVPIHGPTARKNGASKLKSCTLTLTPFCSAGPRRNRPNFVV
jgi:hypothetical protein